MFFTDITSEAQFNKALKLTESMERSFMYSCGSELTNPTHYITNQFNRHIKISERDSRSKVVGVFSDSYIEFNRSTYFSLPNVSIQLKFGNCSFIKYLFSALESSSLMHVYKEDLVVYAVSHGFEPGKDKLDPAQAEILKHSYKAFMFHLNNGSLDKLSVTEAKADNAFQNIPVKSGSVEEEMLSLILNGQRLELPKTPLNHYAHIKTLMQRAGGKYLKGGFAFPSTSNVPDIMTALVSGKEYNPKKAFQFFGTSAKQAASLIQDVGLEYGDRWLEPSAGRGAVADLARDISPNGLVIELMEENTSYLIEQGYAPINQDFLTVMPDELGLFDKIIANPPFTKGADMKHVTHMFHFLKEGGTLASVMSNSWRNSSHKVAQAFVQWLAYLQADVIDIPAGEFKESGTSIATCKIIFNKSTGAMGFDAFCATLKIAA
jgi:hypothetical protein